MPGSEFSDRPPRCDAAAPGGIAPDAPIDDDSDENVLAYHLRKAGRRGAQEESAQHVASWNSAV